jgi:hypothetical protein
MKFNRFFAAAAGLGLMAAVLPAMADDGDRVPAQTVVTVLGKGSEAPPAVQPQDFKVEVNGKSSPVSTATPLRGDRAGLELVILIDSGARNSLGREMDDVQKFVQSLPPTTAVAIAYMQNGRAVMAQPLTTNKAQALQALHLPGGIGGVSASPYFCLSDLAKNWPSTNRENRREVVMIGDGFDPYNPRFDPDDPYLQAAITDSLRAGVIVHGIFWHDTGFASRTFAGTNTGQNLMTIVTAATGGEYYWQGFSNPVSFQPFFNDLSRRLDNQYELSFTAPAKRKPEVESLKVKMEVPNAKLTAPQQVLVAPGGVASAQQ